MRYFLIVSLVLAGCAVGPDYTPPLLVPPATWNAAPAGAGADPAAELARWWQRFGDPEDLIGVLLWLMSPAAAFVTGIVVPVDGGFSAYSGV